MKIRLIKNPQSGPVSRVLLPLVATGDHLSGMPIARHLAQPTRESSRTGPVRGSDVHALLSAWPCSRWGLPSRTSHPARW